MVVTEPTGAHRSHNKPFQGNKHTNSYLEAEDQLPVAEKSPGGVDEQVYGQGTNMHDLYMKWLTKNVFRLQIN